MSFNSKRLYELLPALYRIRDNGLGQRMLTDEETKQIKNLSAGTEELIQGPLKSLLSIIAEQITVLEENLEQLYDDQFIETCAEWAISYIGELVGTRQLIYIPDTSFSQRAEVANTIRYRRRKGTISVIEQLARDVTNWDASVMEYFQLLATTQYMSHLRPGNLAVAPLKKWELLEYSNTPFDKLAHTIDVRSIYKNRGKYNIRNIGIFLWRLKSFSLTRSPAYKVDERRYTFDPLGRDTRLYNLPATEETITHLAEPVNVPMPIPRRVLASYLDTYYGKDKNGKEKSILIYSDGSEVLPDTNSPSANLSDVIMVCNLSNVLDDHGTVTGWAHIPKDKIAIDPVLGRIAFPAARPAPLNVHVSFYYGFSAEIGGGEYDRAESFTETDSQMEFINVTSGKGTIQQALDQLAHEKKGGVIEITDNEYYLETAVVKVSEGKTIELRAADKSRPILVLSGDLKIEAEKNARVILNGLLICGGGRVRVLNNSDGESNNLQLLRIVHCTLVPGQTPAIQTVAAQPSMPRLIVESAGTFVEIEKTIAGAFRIAEDAKVSVTNSIIDAGNESSIAYIGVSDLNPGGVLRVVNSTVIGKVFTRVMEMASNSIFHASLKADDYWPAPVRAERLQQGCIRFSYVPPGSMLPRPYHCQPALPEMVNRVRPVFTSLVYGDSGYGQLSQYCAVEITQGADDEAEMGAFHDLYQPQRVANLRTRIDEYVRFGLEWGVFYAS